jgi:hypothetical protein
MLDLARDRMACCAAARPALVRPHSSGVEHSLGKGEVQSSNLCVGTTLCRRLGPILGASAATPTRQNEAEHGENMQNVACNTPGVCSLRVRCAQPAADELSRIQVGFVSEKQRRYRL